MSPPDCANHPTTARPNADITGIGISLAWLITAGLALSLVIASYFIAYRPDFNPFTLENTGLQSERGSYLKSNPIDYLFLKWRLRKATVQVSAEAELQSNRIREALTLCMLTMSDYQLITGLAVLISAYSQLNSGISTLQWDRVIDLAWFSSITHLCCLTFLRDYFVQNKRAQIWRISGMIVLVILLVVALVPSSRYSLRSGYRAVSGVNPTKKEVYDLSSDYAYCFFKPCREGSRPTYFLENKEDILNKKQNVMISAAILIIGIVNRIWRLYETSTRFYIIARGWISRHIKRLLRWTLNATQSKSFMLVALLYRPILACYLVCHLILDVVLSKAFEVYWLTIGFFWGLINLIGVQEPDDQ
ncbi:hypothetical protein E8E13_003819 [Curvularia kusanoi]|uniref:Uncharacterized protein n=1 Tax=Curvularia kusanoi TaxID=90978 RepID=A0A9P4TEI5_CURKU|nr:hypothetical protein E8E13_003819 [Curvularia kusanoi]